MEYGIMHEQNDVQRIIYKKDTKEKDFFTYYRKTQEVADKVLINPNGEKVTYQTLSLMIKRVSHNLYKLLKNCSCEVVALLISNGCDRIAVVLALIQLGISFCPLQEPITESMLSCISQIKANFLITDDHFPAQEKQIDLGEVKLVSVETLLLPSDDFVDSYEQSFYPINKDSIICILFTSGSTGKPKAVKITHRNMIQTVEWFRSKFDYEKNEIMCSKSNFVFIDYFTETLSALCMKESCLFLRSDQVKNTKVFLDLLSNYKVTKLYSSVSLLRSLLLLLNSDYKNKLYLREVWSSGEDLNQSLVLDFFKCLPYTLLWNVYGSTETCGNCMYSKMHPLAVADNIKETFIGETFLPNIIAYIVDSKRNLINNLFEIGELWVSGSVVSPGYLSNDAENIKFFDINPFYNGLKKKFKTVYKTGDFVILRENGIYKVGRNKDFFKIRGNKVNISEVEKTIQSFYPFNLVAVVARQVNDLTDFYCFISPKTILLKSVIKLLNSKIPSFMIPRILFLDTMPYTEGSDKIDRQKLITLIPSNKHNAFSKEEIMSIPIKNQFKYIAALVLNTDVSTIDLECSFFELGGDSVSVWVFIEKLKSIGLEVTFEEMSFASSINELIKKFTKENCSLEQSIKVKELKVYHVSEASSDIVDILVQQHTRAFKELDPISKHLSDPNFEIEFSSFVKTMFHSFPRYSFYATFCGQVVGVAISCPRNIPLEVNYPPAVDAMLSLYEKEIEQELPSSKFSVLDFATIHADLKLSREIACQVIVELSRRVIEFATEEKFDAVSTLSNNVATFNIDTQLLGFKLLSTININTICVKEEYPFKGIKDALGCVGINYISENAKTVFSDKANTVKKESNKE
ncbi:tyrocidine synthase 3 [Hydra vulgaris]|uniref:Tyrocidine synthase 3 n=1 Tax=Hydra vulgaris TaxID=6087 RepID=A0ABM4CHC9_HYDVU